MENIKEQLKDTLNIVQLLMTELSSNQDDTHILRSVTIIEKMLKSIIRELESLSTNQD